ncbi:MAG: hypothetical protein ACE5R3_00635 [Nitrosopumilaceae archaeon]
MKEYRNNAEVNNLFNLQPLMTCMGFLKKLKDTAEKGVEKGSDLGKKGIEKGTELGTKGVKSASESAKKGYKKGKQ